MYVSVTRYACNGILEDNNLLHLQFDDPETDAHLGTYCGSEAFSVRSFSNALIMVFQSDFIDEKVYSGFVLSWKCKLCLLLYLANATKHTLSLLLCYYFSYKKFHKD